MSTYFQARYVLSCVQCQEMGDFSGTWICLTVENGVCFATAISVAINRRTLSVLFDFSCVTSV